MSYQVFARKYRPKSFDDVLGQDHVVRTLRNAIAQDRLAHAYLFVGPRGTGKTSTARIFAKALNCSNGPSADFDPNEDICVEIAEGRSLDVLEIDGASNNGVEQVRELRDNVKFAPARCRYKIYYIDEVHMLTTAAFNALLKTLEEPPEHVKFIFATTEPNKILPTIISRCQRFDLRRIPVQTIAQHLLHIAQLEGVALSEKAAFAIGKGAEGGMRDAQSMMDQLVAFCGNTIEEDDVLEIFGFTGAETVAALAGCLLTSDTVGALRLVDQQTEAGKDLGRLLGDLIQHIRTLLVYQADPEAALEDLSPELAQMVSEQAPLGTTDQLLRMVDGLAEVDARMRWASNKRLHFELGVIQGVQTFNEVSLDDVISALDADSAEGLPRRTTPPRRQEATTSRRAATPAADKLRPVRPSPADAEPVSRPKLTDLLAEQETEATRAGSAEASTKVELESAQAPARVKAAVVASPELFWGELLKQVAERRPLNLHWLQVGTLLGIESGRVKVGFPKSEAPARDSLMRDLTRMFLEEVATELLGVSATFEMVIDASLQEPEIGEMTLGLIEAVAPKALPASAPERDESAAAVGEESAERSPADDAEALNPQQYQDPLVDRAVDRFMMKQVP